MEQSNDEREYVFRSWRLEQWRQGILMNNSPRRVKESTLKVRFVGVPCRQLRSLFKKKESMLVILSFPHSKSRNAIYKKQSMPQKVQIVGR